jgi:hypothetical protein
MSSPVAPMLLTGGISFTNEWLGNGDFDIKILIATGVATGILVGVAQIPGLDTLATGIAWIAFITLMFTKLNGKNSPWQNLQKLTGF